MVGLADIWLSERVMDTEVRVPGVKVAKALESRSPNWIDFEVEVKTVTE